MGKDSLGQGGTKESHSWNSLVGENSQSNNVLESLLLSDLFLNQY